MKVDQILEKLDEIQALKFKIEDRIWQGSEEVTDVDGTVLSEENIQARIGLLARQLKEKYPEASPVLVSIMDGAMPFSADLNNALIREGYSFQSTAMQVSSYGNSMSSGSLKIGAPPKVLLGGRTVVIVDEVLDTGKTCAAIKELFTKQGAKKVLIMVLVDKEQKREFEIEPDFVGFTIDPKAFIVGKGLDFSGLIRNTNSIRAVDVRLLPTDEEKALLDSEVELNEMLRQSNSGLDALSIFSEKSSFAAAPQHESQTYGYLS